MARSVSAHDRQARVHPQVGGDHRAVADVQILGTRTPGSASPLRRPRASPPSEHPPRHVRRARNVEENLRHHAHRLFRRSSCATLRANSFACGMKVGMRRPWLSSTLPERPEPRTSQAHVDVAVERLHAEQDDGFPRPSERVQACARVRNGCRRKNASASVREPEQDAPPARLAAGQHGGQQPHGVGPRRIARGLDVRVLVQVEARADRDRPSTSPRLLRHAHADQRFGSWCAPGCPSCPLIARQRALLLQPEQKIHRAQRRSREDHAAAGEAPASLA